MGLISTTNIADGTVIDANDVNSPINTIVNEINGNISEANLANSAVTTSKIATDAITTSKIDDEAVTIPKIYNPYKFHAYRSAAWTAGASTKVQLEAVVFDTNGDFDYTTNYRYDVPVTGYYQINFGVHSSVTAGTGYYASVWRNGSIILLGSRHIAAYTNASGWNGSLGSAVRLLNAGDYLELYHTGIAGGTGATGNSATFMSGFLVSIT